MTPAPRSPDAVTQGRVAYLGSALLAQVAERRCRDVRCGACRWAYLRVDAASISLDLANAEAHKHPEGGTVEETRQHPALVYHAPTPEQVEKINDVRDALSAAIYAIQQIVPGCAEQTLAIRKLEECSFYANKAIVFDGQRYL